jgi:ligand-binding SRPBCC domain-containing protein
MAHEFVLHDQAVIDAPLERCFLLSTSIEIIVRELGMRPVAGRTSGLVRDGDTIRWEGWQLGLPQFHVSRIELFRPPTFFRDRMSDGRFRTFEHDHSLAPQPGGQTLLSDELLFTMHWGWFGDLLGYCLLAPYIRRLMRRRFALLKQIAEGDEWRKYLPTPQ